MARSGRLAAITKEEQRVEMFISDILMDGVSASHRCRDVVI